jgi:TRAP transporter TAXI family solute receptor
MLYDAFSGAGFFQYINIQYDNLRLLLPFYQTPISLIVRGDAGISSLNDLAGKRVNGGALYSKQNQVFAKIMAIKNWNKDNFRVYQNISSTNAQDFLAMKSGSIQAMLHISMHPDNSLRNLLVQNNSKIIGLNDADINQLIDSKEGFSRCLIEAEMYPELTSDLETLATENLLITSADTDNETVELILNALIKGKRQLQHAHPSFLQNNIGIETLNDSYLHPHPAAILFFQTNINRLP